MCLYTEQLKAKIAKRNKTVYKVLWYDSYFEEYTSPYMGFRYKLGKIYTVKNIIPESLDSRIFAIYEGLHAYTTKKEAFYWKSRKEVSKEVYKVCECTIPKGAEYYLSVAEDNEIVSNQLIINKIIE